MGDFFTFIIIAVFIYNLFAKKDKPPQRRQRSAEEPFQESTEARNQMDREPARQFRPRKGNIFENLERQIRESTERLEKELQGRTAQTQRPEPVKPAPVKSYRKKADSRPTAKTSEGMNYEQTEGVWGEEGRSDYDKYVSQQGTVGTEGIGGAEGSWGSEGSEYAQREIEKFGIDRPEPRTGSNYPQQGFAGALGFSSSEIVQGIIWAEVLKEPRGKRGLSRR